MRIKNLLLPLSLLLCLPFNSFAQQVEKTLVKSFNLNGNQQVLLDLKGQVEVKTWKNDILRVQMTISIPNGSEAMLKSLVTARRYNLQSQSDEIYKIFAPGLEREVKLRGKPLEENISFTIFAPEDVLIKLANEASTSLEADKKPSTL